MGFSRVGSNPTRSVVFWKDKTIHTGPSWIAHTSRSPSCDGRVVKALDLKSNGIFPRRFEPYSQRYFLNRFPLLVVQQEPYLMCQISLAAMAEWLRRLTRNQMGSSRVGSNPTRSVCWFHLLMNLKISPRPVHCRGIEPRSPAWQARILPLNQQCLCSGVNDIWVTTWVSFSIQLTTMHWTNNSVFNQCHDMWYDMMNRAT